MTSLKSLALAVLARDAHRDASGMTAILAPADSGTKVGRSHGKALADTWLCELDHLPLDVVPVLFEAHPSQWRSAVVQARRLVDAGWAERLHDLGWSELDLFGCSAGAPAQRTDLQGLAFRIEGMDLRCADHSYVGLVSAQGARFTHRRLERSEPRVPLWICRGNR